MTANPGTRGTSRQTPRGGSAVKPAAEQAAVNNIVSYIARQPVYDAAMATIAYELVYRGRDLSSSADAADPRLATLQVVANAALEIGLDRLSAGLPVHLNFPRELLVDDPLLPLHPNRVVIEVLENVWGDEEVLAGIKALRARGHRIALNNYASSMSDPALLNVADIVKIDITHPTADELTRTVQALKSRGIKLMARNVETLEQFERCAELGFEGFQGNVLQHPQTFLTKRVPASRMGTLRLVASLQNAEYAVDEVERLISQDVAMSYRVLRCINSSYYNLPRKVESIRQAIIILGLENLRQLCTLVALQGFDDRPPSLFLNAMTRARMCEQLGRMSGAQDAGPYFITGLFSLLNVLVGVSTASIVKELPLAPAVERALLHEEGELGAALRCARSYERADGKAEFAGLNYNLIRAAYVDSVFWAEEARTLFSH